MAVCSLARGDWGKDAMLGRDEGVNGKIELVRGGDGGVVWWLGHERAYGEEIAFVR